MKMIETKEDTPLLEQISFHTKVGESLNEVDGNIDTINSRYKYYHKYYSKLRKNEGKVKKLQLLALLKEGRLVLVKDVVQDNYCPLCQQEKSKVVLIAELNKREKPVEYHI